MRRRTRIALAAALTAAVGAVVGLVAFRVTIVEALLTEVLLARGVPMPRLTVAGIGWRSSRIADLRLGDADEVALREMRLDYSFSGLLAGRLDQATMTGLSVALDLTGTGPPLGSLQPLLAGEERGNGGTGAATLPNIVLDDVRLVARTAHGAMQATGSGRLRGAADSIAAELSLPAIAFDGDSLASGRLAVDLTGDQAEASLRLDTLAGDFSVDAAVSLKDPLEAPRWRLDVTARAAAYSPVWAAWPGPAPSTGRAEVTVRGKGKAPPFSELMAAGDPIGLLLAHEADASVNLAAADVTVPEHVDGLSIGARVTLEAGDGAATVTFQDAATVAVQRISPIWLRSLGTPDQIAQAAAQGFTARLQQTSEERPAAIVKRDGDAFSVVLDGTAQLAVPGMIEVGLSLPVDARIAPSRLSGRLRAPADVRLAALRYSDLGELLAPVAIAVPEARVDVALDAAGGPLDYHAVVDAPALRARLNRKDAESIEAAITPGRIAATPGRIDVSGAGIDVPAYEIAADGIAATIDLAGTETHMNVRVAALRHTGARPLLASMALAGTIAGQGTLWQASLTGDGPGGVGRVRISGTHDSATGLGSARLTVPPLLFAPGGAQPGTLVPVLAALQRVTGTAEGEAELSWSTREVRGSGAIALRGIGFDSPQARVEGLDLGLHLDNLIPPSSPPRQILTVRRLDAGLPLDRLAITFQIQPAEPPRLAIEAGEVFFGSGRLAVDGVVVDPAAAQQRVELRVEDLSLSELFAILGIDGLSGEGHLSGTIPMQFAGESVVIDDGHLAAGAPGIIRFRSEQAAQILAGQGESLDLVLRALEDFHYDELTVDLAKSVADVGRMKLSLLGNNPAVLEGYPFRFNISIEANTGKLVTALTTIYQVPNDLLRRAWTSGR